MCSAAWAHPQGIPRGRPGQEESQGACSKSQPVSEGRHTERLQGPWLQAASPRAWSHLLVSKTPSTHLPNLPRRGTPGPVSCLVHPCYLGSHSSNSSSISTPHLWASQTTVQVCALMPPHPCCTF